MSFPRRSAPIAALLLAVLCAGCANRGRYASGWDGRRGYDGSGDYGYDLNAARGRGAGVRGTMARSYAIPGPRDDPWGPYIRAAASRFQVPERWIREVMRQESDGRQNDSAGMPLTSDAGAMGLMQVMPATYDMLRQRYALGADPYEPRDNIFAGAAYIREMYDQFGAPGFLAAYNAGPERLADYLAGASPLPDETVNYLARVAPRLGLSDTDTTRPRGGPTPENAPENALLWPAMAGSTVANDDDPADRAFDGGGLVTADSPTGFFAPPPTAR